MIFGSFHSHFVQYASSRTFLRRRLLVLLTHAQVDFFATYVADVMTSSVKTTQDIAWGVCFFLSGDFLLDLNRYHETGVSWQVRKLREGWVGDDRGKPRGRRRRSVVREA